MTENLKKLQKNIACQFQDEKLLITALTHRSYLNEHPQQKQESNERLEFLGDAILEFVVSRFLFEKFPHLPEGRLTNLRSKLVCTKSLASAAKKLNLGNYLFLSKGEKDSNGASSETTLANTFEALIGAIYFDQGLSQAFRFINQQLLSSSKKILTSKNLIDFKSRFQEIAQEKFKITPRYQVIKSSGPNHAKTFIVQVLVGKEEWGRGQGKSKQEAEQLAAKVSLKLIKKIQLDKIPLCLKSA